VLVDMAKEINPNVKIKIFGKITEHNLNQFLNEVDIYVDGMDFFEIQIRRLIFKYCADHAISAITAAPIGMGVAYLVFTENSMNFEDYFDLGINDTHNEQIQKFILGLTPKLYQNA